MNELYELIRRLDTLEIHASHEMVVDRVNELTTIVMHVYDRLRTLENNYDHHQKEVHQSKR